VERIRAGRARVVGDEPRGPDDRGRWYTRRVVHPTVLIEALEARGWLPTIYFIFSRVGCERAMQDVLTEGKSLLAPPQQREVDTAIGDLVRESPTVAESVLNQSVFDALRLGIGVHHAGILPSVKRLIEVLFERGLCKAVFATETMSLGIHMPARSVVLQGLTKRTDRGFRSLSHNELTQMAGRAGRRGIDAEGTCVIALDARDGLDDLLRVIDSSPEPIESQFKLGYGSVALLLSTGAPPDALRRRIESSFGQYQNLKRIREVEAILRKLEASLEELRRYPRRAASSSGSAAIAAPGRSRSAPPRARAWRRQARRARSAASAAWPKPNRGDWCWWRGGARPWRWCSGSTPSAATAC
jgi:superfamily II RNA helicase